MAKVGVNLDVIKCSMGIAPMPLTLMPSGLSCVTPSFTIASIINQIPFVNIKPFVLCQSPANPAVAAIIAATLGSVQKGPCLPNIAATWIPMQPNILIQNMPVLTNNSKLFCIYGGVIEFILNKSIIEI